MKDVYIYNDTLDTKVFQQPDTVLNRIFVSEQHLLHKLESLKEDENE